MSSTATLSNALSATLVGVDARRVEVEVEVTNGLPKFSIIGLGDTAVQESRFRVQAALRSEGLELTSRVVTVNLAPAAVRKDGAGLDLPICLSLLAGAGSIPRDAHAGTLSVGELALSGELRPVRGALSIAVLARELGCRRLIVPAPNGPEAAALGELEVLAPRTLGELVACLRGERSIEAPVPDPVRRASHSLDLADVKGQAVARRGLELAAAGEHNLLLVGSPGSGKTMLARRIPSILPEMSSDERIEVTKVWSAAGLTLDGRALLDERPFRAPHHSLSPAGLVGGGSPIRPGEISLAHRGVLFLDEMPELARGTLELLRQPLEDRFIVIARARQTVRLPAGFILIGAANPCPCGWLGHASGRCRCGPEQVQRYVSRLSGALLDRIDMVIPAPSVPAETLVASRPGEASAPVRARVEAARRRALDRSGRPNGRLHGALLDRHVRLTAEARTLLQASVEKLGLSGRALARVLRVSRTIADLEGGERVGEAAVAEALSFRAPAQWSDQAGALV